jgi:hypothetical protein
MPIAAAYSTADQLCRGFMLSENSRIQAVPALDIESDEIECSHGVAISDLDENELFYLQSRGFDRLVSNLRHSFVLVFLIIVFVSHAVGEGTLSERACIGSTADVLEGKS